MKDAAKCETGCKTDECGGSSKNIVGRLEGIYTLPEHVKVEEYDCF